MSTISKNCTWSVKVCGYLSLRRNGTVHHSEKEPSLRHLQLEPLGLLELVVVEHRDVHNREDLLQQTLQNWSWEKTRTFTRPAASRLSPLPRNQLLGLLGAARDRCNKDGRSAQGSLGHSPEGGESRRTSPPGNNSRGSVTHRRTNTLPLESLAGSWLAPGFTSQSPKKVGPTGY